MRFTLALLPLAAGLVLAACGSGGGYTSAGQPVSAATATAAAKHARVDTRRGALGTFLVDAKGRTLYRFAPDTKPGQTKGQGVNGFGALWYVVSPSGRAITASGSSAPSGP